MARSKRKPVDRIKQRLTELAYDHVRLAFNSGFDYATAVQPKGTTVKYCRMFVDAFREELRRIPTRDK